MARKVIPDGIQTNILLRSRRRCCLCFWLKGDDEVKKGQLAHLDGDNGNCAENNLVFLCLEHHDEYDSTPRLSKGLREKEVRVWRDELYKEMEYRFRTIQSGPLSIHFDEARHRFTEDNGQCANFRIAVRNDGVTTINNVCAKIIKIKESDSSFDANLQRFVGVNLGLSPNPYGEYSLPSLPPESKVLLHPGEEAIFDVVRLCILPGNFLICHSEFLRYSYTPSLTQKPDGVIPPGKYEITIATQGDNLSAVFKHFEFTSTTNEVWFRSIDIAAA